MTVKKDDPHWRAARDLPVIRDLLEVSPGTKIVEVSAIEPSETASTQRTPRRGASSPKLQALLWDLDEQAGEELILGHWTT